MVAVDIVATSEAARTHFLPEEATMTRRARVTIGVLVAGLVLTGVATWFPQAAQPQIMGDLPTVIRTFRLGPVNVNPDETLRISFSNIFEKGPAEFSVSFLDANNGTLLGALKQVAVEAGKGASTDFTSDTSVSVIAVVTLAEPRPDPILTAQLLVNGSAAWLAEPRPDPILKKLGF